MVARRKKYVKKSPGFWNLWNARGLGFKVLKDGKHASVGHIIMDECLHTFPNYFTFYSILKIETIILKLWCNLYIYIYICVWINIIHKIMK